MTIDIDPSDEGIVVDPGGNRARKVRQPDGSWRWEPVAKPRSCHHAGAARKRAKRVVRHRPPERPITRDSLIPHRVPGAAVEQVKQPGPPTPPATKPVESAAQRRARLTGSDLAEYERHRPRVEWDWDGRIIRRKVNLLAGDPGQGKSCVLEWFARSYCGGKPWPDGSPYEGPVGKVLLIDTEGNLDLWVERAQKWGLPRKWFRTPFRSLDAHGNDSDDADRPIDLDDPEDRERLLVNALLPDVVVIFVDSLLGGTSQSVSDDRIRRTLRFLREVARKSGKTVIVVHHLRKKNEFDQFADRIDIDRVLGSRAITAETKSIMGIDKPDPQDDWHRLYVVKSNRAKPERVPALGMLIATTPDGKDLSPKGVLFSDKPPQRPASLVPKRRLTTYQQTVVNSIQAIAKPDEGLEVNELVAAFGSNARARRKMADKLVEKGWLKKDVKGGRVRYVPVTADTDGGGSV